MDELLEALRRAVLMGDGHSPTQQRQQVSDYASSLAADPAAPSPLSGPLAEWTDKVAKHAYQCLDREVDAMRESGLSEDTIFELTVATAYGAARGRFGRARSALDEGYGE